MSRRGLFGLGVCVGWILAGALASAEEGGPVEFIEPVQEQPARTIWEPESYFLFHVNPSGEGGVTQCKLLEGHPLNGQEFIHHYPLWEHDEEGSWVAMNVPNGECTLTAEAYHFSQLIGCDSVTVYVNNVFLFDVPRDGTLTVKWLTPWRWQAEPLGMHYTDVNTTGAGHEHAQGNHTGDDHRYCNNADTPPYDEAPVGEAVRKDDGEFWDHDNNPYYEVHFHRSTIAPNSCMGHWFIRLPDTSAPCGCYRTAILIHGGGPRSIEQQKGLSWVMRDTQQVYATYGCIRLHNGCPLHVHDLEDLARFRRKCADNNKPVYITVREAGGGGGEPPPEDPPSEDPPPGYPGE
ncbi:MAG: hypothetical protein ACE5O2_05675 [Armatimonadota bacterium]